MKPASSQRASVDPSGRLRAFEEEFDGIYRMLRRHGVRPADAEDLAQDVFLVMCRRWEAYDPARPLRHWLSGIAFKVAQAHSRRAKREATIEPRLVTEVPDRDPVGEEYVDGDRTRHLLLQALADLPERHRAVLVMHAIDELPMREIAAIMSVPLFTAYTRLRTARQALLKSMRRTQVAWGLVPALNGDDVPALLARERAPVAAPAEVRARAIDRARAAIAGGLDLSATPAPAPPVGRPWALIGAGAIAVVAVVAVVAVNRLRSGPPPAGGPRVGGAPPTIDVPRDPARPLQDVRRESPAPGPADLPAQLGRGLVGYWRFDDGAGSAIARDLSGNRNDCRLRQLNPGNDWVPGVLGGALAFDGHGWLECPVVEPLARLGGELSISLWLRRERAAPGIHALVSRQLGSANKDALFLGLDGLFLEFSSHQLRGVLGRPLPTALGHWVHVAAVRADSGVTKLFVNGTEVGRRTSHGAGYGGGSTPLIIGGGINGPGPNQAANELFEGAMDELALYGRALSDAEVEALAAGTQPAGRP